MSCCYRYKYILTRNVVDCTQDHKKSLKIMIIEVVKELVTTENIYWTIPINIKIYNYKFSEIKRKMKRKKL